MESSAEIIINKIKATLPMPTDLRGQIEKITFTNEQTGFTVYYL